MDARCFDLLRRCFDAFDGEEDSVKEEHAELIEEVGAFIEAARAADPQPTVLAALKQAEEFMRGFEDDELQEGINERLATVRAAIELAEGE